MVNPIADKTEYVSSFALVAGLQGHLARAKKKEADQEDFHLAIGVLTNPQNLDKVVADLISSINQCPIPAQDSKPSDERKYFNRQLELSGYSLRLKV